MALFGAGVTLFTASSVVAVYSAPRALALNPFNASARAQLANDIVYVSGDARQIGRAAELSREALDGNPTLAGAYRMIALDNARKGKPEEPAIRAATYLTRRDHIANLWLIEDAVKRGRFDQAMADVDASLRTSRRSQALLFPILAKAMPEPEMRPHFERIFREQPDWLPTFLGYYVGTRQRAVPLAEVMLATHKDLPQSYRDLDRVLIGTMIGQQDFAAARRYEQAIAGGTSKRGGIVHNARFEAEGPYPPIDWQLFREASYGSDIEKGDKGNRLVVVSDEERPKLVARQLVELSPGTYRLAAKGRVVSGNDEARLRWLVDCAERDGPRNLTELRFDRRGTPEPVKFSVPAHPCRNYWISLIAEAGFGSTSLQAEFQSLDLQAIR